MAFRESSLDIVHISSGAGPWSGFCVAAEAESCTAAGSRRSAGSLWSRNYNYRHGERHPRAGTYPEIRASGGAVGGAAQSVEMQAGGLLRLVLDVAVMGDQFAAERGQRRAAAGAAAHLGGHQGPADRTSVGEEQGVSVRVHIGVSWLRQKLNSQLN